MSVVILVGDVLARLAEIPDESIDCVVTSPPYWGLRDYDVDGQIGLEPTLGEHLAVMVAVFREIRRVLKPGGTLWLNYGDCYAAKPNGWSAAKYKAEGSDDRTFRDKPFSTVGPIYDPEYATARGMFVGTDYGEGGAGTRRIDHGGRVVAGGYLKPKDLCMVPQRLAIALQEDGWWVRSIMPWVKRNSMPESISDRPATAIEYVIFLTKSERYTYNADAVRRSASPSTNARVSQDVASQAGSSRAHGGAKPNGPMKAVVRPKTAPAGSGIKNNGSFDAALTQVMPDRNFRNTDLFFDSLETPFGLITGADGLPLAIDVNPQGFSEAHFATFPPALVEPLLRAGCPPGGTVLDPFGGAGTVGMVADRMGLDCTLIELNPEYAEIARKRIQTDGGMFSGVQLEPATAPAPSAPSLFEAEV